MSLMWWINIVLIAAGVAVLAWDGYIDAFTVGDTISEWYQRQFKRKTDWLIFAAGEVAMLLLLWFAGIWAETIIVWSGFWGHVTVANKERFGE